MNLMFVQRVKTKNDINGNPRRGWVVQYKAADGHFRIGFVDEGYQGNSALYDLANSMDLTLVRSFEDFDLEITPGTYRKLKKHTVNR